jgi:hypothetical protein
MTCANRLRGPLPRTRRWAFSVSETGLELLADLASRREVQVKAGARGQAS